MAISNQTVNPATIIFLYLFSKINISLQENEV